MKPSSLICALLASAGLLACDKPTVVNVPAAPAPAPAPVVVPGPAGPTGATGSTGSTGATGSTGKPGDSGVVVVMPMASETPASAATPPK